MNGPRNPARRRLIGQGGGLLLATACPPLAAGTALPLVAAPARVNLGEGSGTDVWAFNGQVPGPTLRVRRGLPLTVAFDNRLAAESTVHWHGLRIDNAMDGVPGVTQAPVAPGGSFRYRFTPPDAGSYWYHAHRFSSQQVGRGLHGLLVVEEDEPYPVDRDLSLVIDDWRLDERGAIREDFGNLHDISHGGRLGNFITVNGTSRPTLAATAGERLRLRLANTANARIFRLALPSWPSWIIAFDGQPHGPLRRADEPLLLAPGQRVDLVVDVVGGSGDAPISLLHRDGALEIARLAVAGSASGGRGAPPPLPPNPLPVDRDPADALAARLDMTGGAMGTLGEAIHQGRSMPLRELVDHGMAWSMNGIAGMPEAPLFGVERGRTVRLRLDNQTRWPHAMHLHGHHFRVAMRNDRPMPGAPWRDTTLLAPGEVAELRFVADNPGKWLIHCHMLEHAAGGMMTWFEVG